MAQTEPQTGQRRTVEGQEQMYTPAQGGWIDVKQPPEPTQKLDETQAPETEETAKNLAETGDELKEAGEPRIDTTELLSGTAGMDDLLEMYTQKSQQILEQQQETQKSFLDKLKTTFKPSERRAEVLEEAGVPEQMTQLQESIATAKGIRENIINLESQRDATLAANKQRAVSMATISREQAKIEEDFNRRIATASKRLAAESAHQQALQGNISLARSMAQQEVEYAMWEENRRVKILETTYEMNQDTIKSMGEEYDKIFQLAISEAERKRSEKKEEKDKISQLELSASTEYGIKLDLMDKTYEEAIKEYNEMVAPLVGEERRLELARKRKALAGEPVREPVGEQLDIMDIKRYQELYPEAGIDIGDTEATANYKVYLNNLPAQIEEYKNNNYSKEEVKDVFKQQNEGEITPEEEKIIDDTYEEPSGWAKLWSGVWHRLPFVK